MRKDISELPLPTAMQIRFFLMRHDLFPEPTIESLFTLSHYHKSILPSPPYMTSNVRSNIEFTELTFFRSSAEANAKSSEASQPLQSNGRHNEELDLVDSVTRDPDQSAISLENVVCHFSQVQNAFTSCWSRCQVNNVQATGLSGCPSKGKHRPCSPGKPVLRPVHRSNMEGLHKISLPRHGYAWP